MKSNIVCIDINLTLKAGKEETFQQFINLRAQECMQFKGNLHASCAQSQTDPTKFHIHGEWASQADWDAYLQWRTETGFFELLAEYIAAEPEFNVSTQVVGSVAASLVASSVS